MFLSIRNVVTGIFLVLSTPLALFTWTALSDARHAQAVYEELDDLSRFNKALFDALLVFRSERGDSRAAVTLDVQAGAGSVESMNRRRAAVDASMAQARAIAARLRPQDLNASVAQLMERYGEVAAFRGVIDAELGRPLNRRSLTLSADWMAVASAFLAQLEQTSLATEAHMRSLDPSQMPLLQMRAYAWATRATAGDSLVILNNAVAAGEPLGISLQERLSIADATAAYAWGNVGVLVNHPDSPDAIRHAYQQASQSYFEGPFAQFRADLVARITSGEAPGLTIDQWRAQTTEPINSIAAVASLAMDMLNEGTGRARAAAEQAVRHYRLMFGAVLAVAALGMAIIVFRVIRPMSQLTQCMNTLARGDLSVTVRGAKRRDEMGEMARSVAVFLQAAKRNKELEEAAERSEREREEMRARTEAEAEARLTEATGTLAANLKRLAEGDLMCEITEKFAPRFEALRNDFNTSLRQLRQALGAVGVTVDTVNSGSSEISAASDDLARRTEQQAATIEETSAAMQEITINVATTSRRATEAREIVGNAHSHTQSSSRVVETAVSAMEGIENASHQISQIIGLIDEIAFQTNLLALNAAVEAARAGEAGKGFAVVAQEVRLLAQRSATAAKEIKGLIANSEVAVSEGVVLVNETGKALAQISGMVQAINDHMTAIASEAKDQSVAIGEVNSAIALMEQTTQQNAALVEEMNAASEGLAKEARSLSSLLTQFKVETGSHDFTQPQAQTRGWEGESREIPLAS